jgi:eukaryotic-like serine/threonine-protein kinase
VSLRAGDRLGPYEILAPIGKGGMGEVYRARDTRLQCDVALKVLPAAFSSDPDRMARFQREAQVLASLDHPNIGHIYGIVESDGTRALALALVEGPTLADRTAGRPLPQEEALATAKQIIEAVESWRNLPQ